MIHTVVVGHGLAGRVFHCPLICRQPSLRLHGIVVRDPQARAEAVSLWNTQGYSSLDEALDDPAVDLIVLATPHDVHAEQAIRTLEAGKHCVVDKVMALTSADADRMIAARDASGRMLSVFHNRRWDWDFQTVRDVLASGRIGQPVVIESAVCRHSKPRTWRGRADQAGTVLHDWGAHLIDQAFLLGFGPCRRLRAWLAPAPWDDIDTGGHGRIVLEFEKVFYQVETSRMCHIDRPRWWIMGTSGGLVKYGVDPQENALRAGDLDRAEESPSDHARVRREQSDGSVIEEVLDPIREGWDAYYRNIAEHLTESAPLAVTAEQAREVVRVLDAASLSAAEQVAVEGPWGTF